MEIIKFVLTLFTHEQRDLSFLYSIVVTSMLIYHKPPTQEKPKGGLHKQFLNEAICDHPIFLSNL